MTWRDVLDCKIPGGHRDRIAEMAFELGYEFICHNGQIISFRTALTVETIDGEKES